MRIYPESIRQQILWVNLLPFTLLIVLLSVHLINSGLDTVEQGFRDRGQAIVQQLATASIQSLFNYDYDNLELLTEITLQQYPDVEEMEIVNQHGFVIVQKRKHQSNNRTTSVVFNAAVQTAESRVGAKQRITDQAVPRTTSGILTLGQATLWLNDKASHAAKREIIVHTLLLTAGGLIFSALLAVVLSSRMARPIEALTSATKKLRKGDLKVHVDPRNDGEIGELQRGFNDMARDIASATENMHSRVEHATQELQDNMETMEIQNVELDLARKRALEAVRVKSEFLASMSHEIRTPMNGILGFTNLLKKTTLSSLQKEYLETMETSASSLLAIINDILDFSKLEADKLVLEEAPFLLRSCIDNSIALLAPLAHQKRIELVAQVYNDVPEQLIGDQIRIAQIITNLVNNAIKFTDEGEVTLKIMLEEDAPSRIKLGISVTDTGIGIAANQQSSIFSAFSQVSSSDKILGGTGLGLSICKHLVNAMQGTISLSSRQGEGACFKATITLAKASLSGSYTSKNSLFSGRRVLLIEPHKNSRLVLHNQLQELGMPVFVADTYQQAESLAQDVRTELVIAGISGKGLEDSSSVSALKRILSQLNKPVLLLVGSSSQQACHKFEDYQPLFCTSKPTRRTVLEDILAKLLLLQKPTDTTLAPQRKQLSDQWLARFNIMVVDDNAINLNLMEFLLGSYGARVLTAGDGEEAVSMASSNPLDLIIMDIHMPRMNGFEAAEQIHQQADNRHTPIVALTADAMQKNKDEITQHSFNAYLIKPIDEDRLKTTLTRLLLTGTQSDMIANESITTQPEHLSKDAGKELIIRDYAQAIRIAGNSETIANKLFNRLLDELPDALTRIRDLHAKQKWQELWQEVHKLQGAVSVCATPALLHGIQQLELIIRCQDREKISAKLAGLEHEIKRLTDTQKEISS